jgi:hypothetical protein
MNRADGALRIPECKKSANGRLAETPEAQNNGGSAVIHVQIAASGRWRPSGR